MISRTIILFFVYNLATLSYAEPNLPDMFEAQKKESVVFNKTVTDEDIIEYLEAFLKYQPQSLTEFRGQTPEERKSFLQDYRKAHTESAIKIPILRGLSKKEMLKFDEMAKYKANESIGIESAQKRLLSFSNDQYKLILSEAVKLIGKYEEYERNDGSGRVVISSGYPEQLAFLNLESIYLYEASCELLLQNGIGRDIGYGISQDKDGTWQIKSFDHYTSWESNRINLSD